MLKIVGKARVLVSAFLCQAKTLERWFVWAEMSMFGDVFFCSKLFGGLLIVLLS